MSEITESGIHRKQHRTVKRARNPEYSCTAETNHANCSAEGETSDTVPKTPYSSEEGQQKRPRVITVLPYISVSDANSDGEALKALKEYFVPVGDGFRMNKLGEFVPTALSKTHLKTKESQTLFRVV